MQSGGLLWAHAHTAMLLKCAAKKSCPHGLSGPKAESGWVRGGEGRPPGRSPTPRGHGRCTLMPHLGLEPGASGSGVSRYNSRAAARCSGSGWDPLLRGG
eukprot:CAMPEP_0174309432 /NCGR_PEP_ID=MMETSP0810-20121108/2407_1 /TAXON_ID=73025 ORGANISM="Eutreptiella gymnastica-like, Strain CCMP1594" /NCGR_SAMPLE_ID=MMETSP0810 /ASSEMBLY_ACC=CAM_ASM_000659 /LENGTH=99 /DNA_ID=CAMNT_0015417065 /DNA_START=183 /DNA_END=482 /DNA_ORIENTATION=-